MTRFFFQVEMGLLYPDEHGTWLSDYRAAHKVALEVMAGLIRDGAEELWRGEALRILAED